MVHRLLWQWLVPHRLYTAAAAAAILYTAAASATIENNHQSHQRQATTAVCQSMSLQWLAMATATATTKWQQLIQQTSWSIVEQLHTYAHYGLQTIIQYTGSTKHNFQTWGRSPTRPYNAMAWDVSTCNQGGNHLSYHSMCVTYMTQSCQWQDWQNKALTSGSTTHPQWATTRDSTSPWPNNTTFTTYQQQLWTWNNTSNYNFDRHQRAW